MTTGPLLCSSDLGGLEGGPGCEYSDRGVAPPPDPPVTPGRSAAVLELLSVVLDVRYRNSDLPRTSGRLVHKTAVN